MRRSLVLLVSVSLLGACASVGGVSPLSSFSEVPVSEIAKVAPDDWAVAYQANGAGQAMSWLDSFADEQLQELVKEALANNHNLGASYARFEQAMALARISGAARVPSLSASLSGTGTAVSGAPNTDEYGAGLTASWELDLWGKIRDRAQASGQDAIASKNDYLALRLSIAGQTATAWIDLVSASQQQKLSLGDVQTRERSLRIVERRYKRGLSTSLDIRLARSALAGSKANLAFQQLQYANAVRRLEVLLGRYPGRQIEAASALPALTALAPIASPAELLTRRPDIRSAEARLAAAGLRVAEARKAILPTLSLRSTANTGGGNIGDIFDFDQIIGQLIGSIAQPLFAGGSIKAGITRNQAAQREQLENYAQTVLTAWREVEDALSGERFLAVRETALRVSVVEAKEAERLAEREYVRGVGTIFELLDAQRRRISAEGQFISAASQRASNRVGLYLALGGDAKQQAEKSANISDEEV